MVRVGGKNGGRLAWLGRAGSLAPGGAGCGAGGPGVTSLATTVQPTVRSIASLIEPLDLLPSVARLAATRDPASVVSFRHGHQGERMEQEAEA